jgi:hypothetical protein
VSSSSSSPSSSSRQLKSPEQRRTKSHVRRRLHYPDGRVEEFVEPPSAGES